jgi:hypothetical protein
MVEGVSEETELLIQGRMPTQAQEIDGNVLINDLDEFEGAELRPGDFVSVEITEATPNALIGKVVALNVRPRVGVVPGLRQELGGAPAITLRGLHTEITLSEQV